MARPTGAAVALLTLLAPAGSAGNDTPEAGFSLHEVHAPPIAPDPFGHGFDVFGVSARLSNGSAVTFDGRRVLVQGDSGPISDVLLSLDQAVFPAFVRIAPDASYALIGESSNGHVYRAELDGSGAQWLATLPGIYDADFEGSDSAVVSAALCGWSCGSDLVRLDTKTGFTTVLAHVSGPSGPVAIDPSGDLYYGLFQSNAAALKSVVRFPAVLLNSGLLLDGGDAEVVGSGFAGASSLILDPLTGSADIGGLLLAVNNTLSGAASVVRVGGPQAGAVLVSGQPFRWIADLQWVPGPGPGAYHPFQDSSAGEVLYTSTDFVSGDIARRALRPQAPNAHFSGPGTAGIGPVTLTLEGGPAAGNAILLHAALGDWGTPHVWPVPGLPWISGLELATAGVWPELVALDGNGSGTFAFDNLGGATGVLIVQAASFDGAGAFVGLSLPAAL